MDRTDLNLSRLLLLNSRTSFRELADRMGLSVPVVHTRIRALEKAGVIRAFTARLSLAYLGAPLVIISGPSPVPDLATTTDRLGRDERTWWVGTAGGNFLYVGGYLRGFRDLDTYAAMVAKEAQMREPTVGLVSPPAPARREGGRFVLDRLDYRILSALARDSRRAVTEVAAEVGASAKTAARHLDRMTREGAVDFSIDWYPDASDDILPIFHIRLKPEADKREAMAMLVNTYGPDLIVAYAFSNLPNQLLAIFWTNSMRGLKEHQARLESERGVESAMANVLYTGRLFDTWRDTLVTERAGARPRPV